MPEAGQIFQYRQDDAIYTGFELQWDLNLLNNLKLNQAIDFVQSYNPKTQLALPFTPQPSIRTDLSYTLLKNKTFEDVYVDVGHQYHFAASGSLRIDRSERATPAYQLWEFGIGANIHYKGQDVSLKCQVQNVFNTRYLAHLSRYRIINVPEQGRNIVLSVKTSFGGKW